MQPQSHHLKQPIHQVETGRASAEFNGGNSRMAYSREGGQLGLTEAAFLSLGANDAARALSRPVIAHSCARHVFRLFVIALTATAFTAISGALDDVL
jgi:hypothetical protein